MLDFIPMFFNYEERKVDRYDDEDAGIMVSTAAVTDSDKPFETAVIHPRYNDGKHIIVELYATKEEAQEGHQRWVEKITTSPLPEKLMDVSTSMWVEICRTGGMSLTYEKRKEKP